MPAFAAMPAAAQPAAAAAPAAGAAPAAAPKEEKAKTDFEVKLESFSAEGKIKVIKEVRAITSLGLKEAKELVGGVCVCVCVFTWVWVCECAHTRECV